MSRDNYWKESFQNHTLEVALDHEKWKAFYLRAAGGGRTQSTFLMFTPEGIFISGDLCPGNDARNSGVHAMGYGLDWFSGKLSYSYLAEKFLSRGWQRELAADECRGIAEDIQKGEDGYHSDRQVREMVQERGRLADEIRGMRQGLREADEGTPGAILAQLREYRDLGAQLKMKIRSAREDYADRYLELANTVECGDLGVESFYEAIRELDRDRNELPGYGYDPKQALLLVAIQEKFAELYEKLQVKV